jgi:MoaA/NifB/PqqE/SkfB family radical SAM enzyme
MACHFCDIPAKGEYQFKENISHKGNLDLNTFKSVIKAVASWKPKIHINLTEPLLLPSIGSYIEAAVGYGLKCELTTNGYLLEKRFRELISSGLSTLHVSLDGTPHIHNQLRGIPDAHERTIKGLILMLDKRKKLKLRNPRLFLSYTLFGGNADSLNETVALARSLGLDGVIVSHLNFITAEMARRHNTQFDYLGSVKPSSIWGVEPDKVQPERMVEVVTNVKKKFAGFVTFIPQLNTREAIENYYLKSETFLGREKCLIPWLSLQILSNGDVIPHSRCFRWTVGNVKEQNLWDIWRGQRFAEFRHLLSKAGGATPACTRCCGIFV